MKKRFLSVISAIILCLTFTSCGGESEYKIDEKTTSETEITPSSDSIYEPDFTVRVCSDIETLDSNPNSSVDSVNILNTLYETLLIIDENNKIQPGQAASYTV